MTAEPNLTIRDLATDEVCTAARVLSDGMRDNPLHVAAFGADPGRREAALFRFFVPVLRPIPAKGRILGAFRGPSLIGVCAMTRPGRCQPSLVEKLRIIPAIVRGNRPDTWQAVLRWTGTWAKHDPSAAHWHLGPVAVERDAQGRGIGGRLLAAFCEAMDDEDALSYLETDRRENVGFYEKQGFAVTGEEPVLGVPNWYMERRIARAASEG